MKKNLEFENLNQELLQINRKHFLFKMEQKEEFQTFQSVFKDQDCKMKEFLKTAKS